jgi:class 3 adenylate cyclase/tetratricopeptide (TPR) repeat protein
MSEERKVVTVLFADCVGSTGIGEQLDPEELATIMHAFFDEMRSAIEGEGGVVEKFIGDAVMALFGVPSSHEDDPARALRCGLAMLDRLHPFNDRLERTHGVRFGLRVGVNTGEVLVSNEPGADLGMVTGDVVNVAARLEQFAEPGQVVVAERTARAARGFRFEELGSLALRGKAAPVHAYLLASAGSAASPGTAERGISGLSAPMVGRERELALLRAVVDRSMSESRPHLVTVYGEAGVGKSRLVRELVEWVEQRDNPPLVVRGRCLPYGDGVTYWPMAEILKGLAGVLDSDPASVVLAKLRSMGEELLEGEPYDEVSGVVGALAASAGIVDPGTPVAALAPRELRVEMHSAWRSVLSRLASTRPMLAIIEDIHWADEALLDLLDELAERAVGALVLVCPSRPDLTARRPGWGGGRRNASAISLEPLTLADTSRLVALLLDVEDLPEGARSRILERAEGNPFFLEEILRQLIDERRIVREGARWRAGPSAADVRIPDSVQAVLAARIDLLPARPKQVLQHAAVVGRVFWTGSLGERATDTLDEQLDVLEGRDLISTRLGSAFRGERECIFRHVLTRNVAYESIPRRDRADLHAQVAAWLDDVASGREGEFAELLAHHWSEAHRGAIAGSDAVSAEIERRRLLAYRWCLAASKETYRRSVADRARTFAQRALDLAASPDEVADAALAVGEACNLIGEGSPALAAFRVGADALLDAGAPDPMRAAYFCARVCELVARWPGSLREPFERAEIQPYLDRGLVLAGDGDSEARARLLLVRSFWTWGLYYGSRDKEPTPPAARESDATEAAGIAGRLGLADIESGALDALLTVLMDERCYRRATAVMDRRLLLLPRLHEPLERGDTLCMAAWHYFDLGRYADAMTMASRVPDETDVTYWSTQLHALNWRAIAGLVLGRWDDALTDLTQAMSILRTGGLDQPPPFSCGTLAIAAYIHAARGETEEAERLVELLPPQVGPAGDSSSGGSASVALTLVRLGRAAAAGRRLEHVDRAVVPGLCLVCLAHLDVAEATGEWEAARAMVTERLATPDTEGPPVPNLACGAELAGRHALAAGDLATAGRELDAALALWTEVGAVWPAARVELALARALHGTDTAARHASRALEVFEALGSLDEIDRARALLPF